MKKRAQRRILTCGLILASAPHYFRRQFSATSTLVLPSRSAVDASTHVTSGRTATLCTVIKDPQLRYIDEWADYHMALGFTSLRLYDNSENFVTSGWGYDKSYAQRIERIHFLPDFTHNITRHAGSKSDVQSTAFMDCVNVGVENNVSWVAGLDVDEFLVLKLDVYKTSLIEFMDEFCKPPCGQLSINWLLFGSSNRSRYVPVPVTKRFSIRTPSDDENLVKGIADPRAVNVDQSSFWVHTFPLKEGRTQMDTLGKRVNVRPGQRWQMLINTRKPQDVAVLHHYRTLSEEEWTYKNCERNDVNRLSMKCGVKASEHLQLAGGIYDDSAWQALMRLVPSYEKYDGVADLG